MSPTSPTLSSEQSAAATASAPSSVLDIQEQWRRSIVEYLASLPTASCLVQELGSSVPKPQGVGKNYSVAEVIRRDEMGRFELTGQGPTMRVKLVARGEYASTFTDLDAKLPSPRR